MCMEKPSFMFSYSSLNWTHISSKKENPEILRNRTKSLTFIKMGSLFSDRKINVP